MFRSSQSVVFTDLDDAACLCNAAAAAAALKTLFHTLYNPKVSRYYPTVKAGKAGRKERNCTLLYLLYIYYI